MTAGINYFDTANAYTDSEEKLGRGAGRCAAERGDLHQERGRGSRPPWPRHIDESLRRLRTDYIDLFQFHNPVQMPDIADPDGPFAAALEAKAAG
jgi:aryl-alcohol dehydrogenase-like predicted oxidoreductase